MNVYPTRGLNIGVNYTYQEGKVDVNNDNIYQKYLSGLRIAPPRLNSYVKWMSDDKKLNLVYIICTHSKEIVFLQINQENMKKEKGL
jgi:hypothetical protein